MRDLSNSHDGVMGLVNGQFRPNDYVTRASLAYSLVQAMGLQNEARGFTGQLTAFYDGKRIPVEDAGSEKQRKSKECGPLSWKHWWTNGQCASTAPGADGIWPLIQAEVALWPGSIQELGRQTNRRLY